MVISVTEIYIVQYYTTMAYPVPVFQEKLRLFIFTHFTTYQCIYTVFAISELGNASQ